MTYLCEDTGERAKHAAARPRTWWGADLAELVRLASKRKRQGKAVLVAVQVLVHLRSSRCAPALGVWLACCLPAAHGAQPPVTAGLLSAFELALLNPPTPCDTALAAYSQDKQYT